MGIMKLFRGDNSNPGSDLAEMIKALEQSSGRPSSSTSSLLGPDVVVESFTEIVQSNGQTSIKRIERRTERRR